MLTQGVWGPNFRLLLVPVCFFAQHFGPAPILLPSKNSYWLHNYISWSIMHSLLLHVKQEPKAKIKKAFVPDIYRKEIKDFRC